MKTTATTATTAATATTARRRRRPAAATGAARFDTSRAARFDTSRARFIALAALLAAGLLVFLSFDSSALVTAAQGDAAARALAQRGGDSSGGTANPVVLIIVLGALALAPFALIMLTSFVKISVVLSILRNALGTQQVPPNQVITGISLILTIFVMAPVVEKMYAEAGRVGDTEAIFSEVSVKQLFEAGQRGREPLRAFLERHAAERDRKMFYDLARRMAVRNQNNPDEIRVTDFRIVVPSFVTSQLTEAFKIGFLLFIPFLIIDMVVSNILQAMGMFMLSPTMISLPFKLLLFVLVDGWVILIRNLVLGYT